MAHHERRTLLAASKSTECVDRRTTTAHKLIVVGTVTLMTMTALWAGPAVSAETGATRTSAAATTSPSACKAAQLTVGGFGTSAAAGTQVVTVRIGNTSSRPCSLKGDPTVTFLDGNGAVLRVTVSHNGPWPAGVPTIVLPSGKLASAGFIITSSATQRTATPCPTATSIGVKLPRMASSFRVDTAILVPGILLCAPKKAVDISPIVKAALLDVSPPVLPEAEFPAKFYPVPEKFPEPGDWSGCPDLAGVSMSVQPSRAMLAKLLDELAGGSTAYGFLLASDPSYWPILATSNWARFHSVSPARLVISKLLGSGYVGLAQRCGKTTVSHLWLGRVCNGQSPFMVKRQCREPALAEQVLFLNRSGRWLVVFTYP